MSEASGFKFQVSGFKSSFAYLFERFPSFTQTFCFREVEEMFSQRMEPAVFSIRPADDGSSFSNKLPRSVRYLPLDEELTKQVRSLRGEHKIRSSVWEVFSTWGDRGDKTRIYEAAWLGRILKNEGVRHVHTHFGGIAARTAFWIKKFYGIGYSFTGHANDIFCETHFPVSLGDLVREARFVATVTDFSRDWLRGKFPEQARKIHRVYNGICVGKFVPAIPGAGRPRILSVGRCIEKKGFSDLIEACRLLKQRGVLFECQIVGGGPLEADLRAQVDRSGLAGEVTLTGPRSEGEVMELLAGSTLFALACVRESDGGMDNLPTVIMEAMSCALPVVSTSLAGVPEMVANGETGFLVSEKHPVELAEAIGRLLQNPGLARTLGAKGREVALRKFSTEVTTRHLKHLLARYGRVKIPIGALTSDPALLLRLAQRHTGIGGVPG